MRIFQCTEERVIFEPVAVLLRERFESAAQRCVSGFGVALVSFAQQLLFSLCASAEIDLCRRMLRPICRSAESSNPSFTNCSGLTSSVLPAKAE